MCRITPRFTFRLKEQTVELRFSADHLSSTSFFFFFKSKFFVDFTGAREINNEQMSRLCIWYYPWMVLCRFIRVHLRRRDTLWFYSGTASESQQRCSFRTRYMNSDRSVQHGRGQRRKSYKTSILLFKDRDKYARGTFMFQHATVKAARGRSGLRTRGGTMRVPQLITRRSHVRVMGFVRKYQTVLSESEVSAVWSWVHSWRGTRELLSFLTQN